MKEKLESLLNNSYSPYFNFPVSAIVVTNDGEEFVGVNVENANGTSICAERNAIANAVAHGYKKGDFKEINIMVDKDDIVKCYSIDGTYEEYTIDDLCPYPFTEEDLK